MSEDPQPDTYFERIVDSGALADYLKAQLGPAEPYDISHHGEGHSNETLFVTWGDTELVIRRPPPGEVASSAHDVLREYSVVDALQDTDVCVPPTVAACEDHSILGSDFYVMEAVDGDVIRTAVPDRFETSEHRRRLGTELVDTLVEIHDVDYESVGLGEFGRPAGFTERQVERWRKQFEWAAEVTFEDRRVPGIEDVGEWLAENVPETHPHTLVHGDYKLDNVMFGPGTPPEIVSVFDWELSTLGDPRTDVGWMLSFWWDETDPDPPGSTGDLYPTFMRHPDYPTRRELVDRYERAAGIEFEHQRFYRVLAVYKLAGLGEMFYRRYLEENANDPLYPKMEDGVPELADRARRIIDGNEPL
ncbi:phosphotransferase family protein [Halogeometricum sp. S1BR25-6]|uniref:Phosphotransferase family protein n=1 Tax=Halogeometricum salsisoli TaxID=2950536 RepID=A0ABU2GH97_9EURY|nr:phosphotransferase family protein [Halogeometricum sp. S1BR25-6]MDS0300190.1 phosphotransferase family protein [Halogeometricum sp. S1BR25-6]